MAASAEAEGWARWVAACNKKGGPEGRAGLLPFRVGDLVGGYVGKDFARKLAPFEDAFDVSADSVRVAAGLNTVGERTESVGRALCALRDRGEIAGWRDELYPVKGRFDEEPCLLLERAAAPYFGLKAYGVHVCAYVRDEAGGGEAKMWVARRSRTKQTSPGKLDHLVAGGQPFDLSPFENVVKECAEEAGIPEELAARARPAGAVSYEYLVEEGDAAWGGATGLKRDCLFCYDLELPSDFSPVNRDGEVEEFMLWPVSRVAEEVLTTNNFKMNCNLVLIDFLVRHGHITPENCEGYLSLVSGLRAGECS